MIRSGQIERVVSVHAMPTRQDVDFRVIQHVADVQRTGHVGRRNYDTKCLSWRGWIGAKQITVRPEISPLALNELRFIRFGNLSRHPEKDSSPHAEPTDATKLQKVNFYDTGRKDSASTRHASSECL